MDTAGIQASCNRDSIETVLACNAFLFHVLLLEQACCLSDKAVHSM
jgi:hypothetical protein